MYAHTEILRKFTTELEDTITTAVLDIVKNEKRVAVSFSGGIDSSIIASLASRNTEVMLYSVGTHNAYDLRMAENASKLLGIELTKIEINKEDVEEAIRQLAGIVKFASVVEISFELPLYFVAKKSNEHILISGQGADELFGGYARYLSMEKLKLNEFLQKDLECALVRALEEKKIANNFKKELYAPFLSPVVVAVAMGIPVEYKIYNGMRKYILREVGKSLGIDEEIVTREKKAAQYGSGIMNVIKKLAREKGMNTSQYVLSISKSK
jgi:asparagine synthase (glutamine-hydrolysing)